MRERNVRLIRRVAKQLREKPESYNQDVWFHDQAESTEGEEESSENPSAERVKQIKKNQWVCGAQACVAGHALVLSGQIEAFTTRPYSQYEARRVRHVKWQEGGQKVLGLTLSEAKWLFSPSREPEVMPEVLDALAKGATINELSEIEHDALDGLI